VRKPEKQKIEVETPKHCAEYGTLRFLSVHIPGLLGRMLRHFLLMINPAVCASPAPRHLSFPRFPKPFHTFSGMISNSFGLLSSPDFHLNIPHA
jgi:hypothetical protein